ncbi:hypothetical protein GCM10023331_22710 [Algivirga pacifica]|uniref:POTRA domain-containing protein n=2 Tax=Algivirga pacifica TaxID=1162670 RepID=A0ABP9DH78_9BACT
MFLSFFLWAFTFSLHAQQTSLLTDTDTVSIHKVEVKRNWMTWDLIVKNELTFQEGETITKKQLDTSIKRIWNIGNFADVKYDITNVNGENILTIQALDAVKFYPLIVLDHSSEDDYRYQLGVADENFLGSNSYFRLSWDKQPVGTSWNFDFTLPRQLMYKNMYLRFGFVTGKEVRRQLEREVIRDENNQVVEVNYIPQLLAPFDKMEVYTKIGNPWHKDYEYRFSPDLDLRYSRHRSNLGLLEGEEQIAPITVRDIQNDYLTIGLSEQYGMIDSQRHRRNGYRLSGSIATSIGLNSYTKSFQTYTLNAEYHKVYNKLLQLSFWGRTGYTTAEPMYQFSKGASDVLGIRFGELYGKSFYSAYAGAHFTWINKNWLAVENAYFLNWGNGSEDPISLFGEKPKMSIGTSFVFQVPVAPLLYAKVTFMYAGAGTEWFKFQM